MSSDFTHAADLVYASDRDRFLASLFAREEPRAGLMALYAFNLEIGRIRELVSEPLPGEVRLQWWRDLLEGTEHGEVQANPVANALLQTAATYKLPRFALTAMVDARVFDLYNDPMPSLNDLEGYCGETASALIQLACLVLNNGDEPDTAEIAGHAGVAYGLCGLMRALPWHAARGQMFLPKDLLERHGVDTAPVFKGETTPQLAAALTELREHTRHHLKRVREGASDLPTRLKPAFLPVALVEPFLKRMEKPGHDPLQTPIELSRLHRQWTLWRASRKPGAGI
ncbi:phytoene/squalene synthase family protein [Roseibium limicola]|uniref:Squalene/phytoene synthase family protein n=1 Tax=Roseibium limicola TaxID=2816037 RepID=A0A939J7K7_9HYPH|nr:phytoene/squalene synthase family protein [Roseibium limicola]MBO0346282.1 squalene/phytoene synthase family protein [Roseibium limicola]